MKSPLVCLFLSFASCPASALEIPIQPELAIVNGERVGSGDPVARHTVRLGIGGSLCTGTLIAENIVVTAAHCFRSRPQIDDIQVEMGVTSREVLNVRVHPSYSGGSNDVALLRFSGGLPGGFAPAPIYRNSAGLRAGTRFIVAGFGATDSLEGDEGGVGRLHKVARVVVGMNGRNEIRISGGGGSACGGDSGGPGFVEAGGRLQLVGVVSRSGGEGRCTGAEIHGRVDAHQAWIQQAIASMGGSGGGPKPGRPPRDEDEEDGGLDPDEEEERRLGNGHLEDEEG